MGITTPRKVSESLKFVEEFERLVTQWPQDTKLALTQIAEQTQVTLPKVADYILDILDRAIDIHDPISFKEAEKALNHLKQRLRAEIEADKRRIQREKDLAHTAYEKTMGKVLDLQAGKNWYSAYRTLSYFAGVHEKKLNSEVLTSICNDCLRLGVKAGVNFQELALWLQKGVAIITTRICPDSLEDALDFVDTYGEHFLKEESGKGKRFLTSILSQLNPAAAEWGLAGKIDELYVELNLVVPAANPL